VHNNKEVEIDSRTSDAIALALRFDAPIYTYEFILDQAALSIETHSERTTNIFTGAISGTASDSDDLTKKSMSDLQDLLNKYLEKEEYEKASAIRDEIKRRSKSS
jgi:bifunctional DNase/RNase